MHILAFSPSGQKIELQLHSPLSFEAKVKGHELYKLISLNIIPQEKVTDAKKEVRAIHERFPNPPLIETIHSLDKTRNITVPEYEEQLTFPQHCVLTNCSSTPDMIEIEGYIEDNFGNIISSYSETTDYIKKDAVAVFCDNNGGIDLYVSDPERLDRMIEDAVSSCDLPLLGELEECRCFLEGKEPEASLPEINEQNFEHDL